MSVDPVHVLLPRRLILTWFACFSVVIVVLSVGFLTTLHRTDDASRRARQDRDCIKALLFVQPVDRARLPQREVDRVCPPVRRLPAAPTTTATEPSTPPTASPPVTFRPQDVPRSPPPTAPPRARTTTLRPATTSPSPTSTTPTTAPAPSPTTTTTRPCPSPVTIPTLGCPN